MTIYIIPNGAAYIRNCIGPVVVVKSVSVTGTVRVPPAVPVVRSSEVRSSTG